MSTETPNTFEDVVEKYSAFVYNIALRMTSNTHDAEDITQEAFIDAFRAWDRFRGESQVSTWLYRIAINRSLMKLRKEKKSRQIMQEGLEDQDVVDWGEGPERAALTAELRHRMEDGLRLVPKELRAAVVLRDVQGLSTTEAAEVLGITESALKARLHRGRLLLRKYLEDYVRAAGGG
ncbi:MAG: sigma-70 family RNA polymerase sigma factor [Chloroflexota bacterium]